MASSSSKSILILNRTFPPALGATGRLACDLALYLRSKGHKVTVITTGDQDKTDKAKNLTVHRIGVPHHPEGGWAYYKILRKMRAKAKDLPRHDIVISMTDPPFLVTAGVKIARQMNAKHIHWSMDIYPDLLPVVGKGLNPIVRFFAKRRMRKALSACDLVVPISACMHEYLFHTYKVSPQKMRVIENCPDRYLKDDAGENPKALLEPNKFRILYAGTIGLAHEFETVFQTAKALQYQAPDIEFIFTDRGRGRFDFLKRRDELRLKNVQLLSPQPSKKLSALMASGDLHLVTMKDGALGKLFPSKFYSALAAGRPALFIGPYQCDLHRKIVQHKCGVSIRNGDHISLTQAILDYFRNSDLWHLHSKNAAALLKPQDPLKQWKEVIERL